MSEDPVDAEQLVPLQPQGTQLVQAEPIAALTTPDRAQVHLVPAITEQHQMQVVNVGVELRQMAETVTKIRAEADIRIAEEQVKVAEQRFAKPAFYQNVSTVVIVVIALVATAIWPTVMIPATVAIGLAIIRMMRFGLPKTKDRG